ncbi:unnamed protein product [Diatraea saccharalis]|uniref:ABC transporter domain-containing protein n=1 Tax=Diatraea saccharalis TaxID=40085 RepID=A0A9N9QT69_9NEOP|nr:unnamed protein product [Diatraea saccharalis]
MNVSKVYGDGTRSRKVALNNVSIELHRGQITTLLGHNGAGKTTLINILTGMLKPSSGHVVVRGGDQGEEGAGIGVCPQRDVLFPNLTPREHITLYAQLKARSHYHNVRDEIQNMVRALSLGGACDRRVCRLSGGTRRRLCVALAFIHAPALVTLDEPTAGVDPAARRYYCSHCHCCNQWFCAYKQLLCSILCLKKCIFANATCNWQLTVDYKNRNRLWRSIM